MALWVFVYTGTTPIGTIITGWITASGGTRAALLVGSASRLVAAVLADFVHTPPNPDARLTDLAESERGRLPSVALWSDRLSVTRQSAFDEHMCPSRTTAVHHASTWETSVRNVG
jgi:hypothetical protein